MSVSSSTTTAAAAAAAPVVSSPARRTTAIAPTTQLVAAAATSALAAAAGDAKDRGSADVKQAHSIVLAPAKPIFGLDNLAHESFNKIAPAPEELLKEFDKLHQELIHLKEKFVCYLLFCCGVSSYAGYSVFFSPDWSTCCLNACCEGFQSGLAFFGISAEYNALPELLKSRNDLFLKLQAAYIKLAKDLLDQYAEVRHRNSAQIVGEARHILMNAHSIQGVLEKRLGLDHIPTTSRLAQCVDGAQDVWNLIQILWKGSANATRDNINHAMLPLLVAAQIIVSDSGAVGCDSPSRRTMERAVDDRVRQYANNCLTESDLTAVGQVKTYFTEGSSQEQIVDMTEQLRGMKKDFTDRLAANQVEMERKLQAAIDAAMAKTGEVGSRVTSLESDHKARAAAPPPRPVMVRDDMVLGNRLAASQTAMEKKFRGMLDEAMANMKKELGKSSEHERKALAAAPPTTPAMVRENDKERELLTSLEKLVARQVETEQKLRVALGELESDQKAIVAIAPSTPGMVRSPEREFMVATTHKLNGIEATVNAIQREDNLAARVGTVEQQVALLNKTMHGIMQQYLIRKRTAPQVAQNHSF